MLYVSYLLQGEMLFEDYKLTFKNYGIDPGSSCLKLLRKLDVFLSWHILEYRYCMLGGSSEALNSKLTC